MTSSRVLASAERVARVRNSRWQLIGAHLPPKNSTHVAVRTAAVPAAAEAIKTAMRRTQYSFKTWAQHALHPPAATPAARALVWIFLIDLLNFSFWSLRPAARFTVAYGGKQHTGYWSLCALIKRAIDDKVPILEPVFWEKASDAQLDSVFRTDLPDDVPDREPIPLLDERKRILRDAGRVLNEKFNGDIANVINLANGSALRLVEVVADNFPSFRDEAVYRGERVHLYKRAQILAADLWAFFEGKSYGFFHDIDQITVFADYRIPQTLLCMGLLEYSPELRAKLDANELMPSGSEMEVEIRGCSIWAAELIRREIADPALNSVLIDFYLWDYVKDHEAEITAQAPFHLTRSVYY